MKKFFALLIISLTCVVQAETDECRVLLSEFTRLLQSVAEMQSTSATKLLLEDASKEKEIELREVLKRAGYTKDAIETTIKKLKVSASEGADLAKDVARKSREKAKEEIAQLKLLNNLAPWTSRAYVEVDRAGEHILVFGTYKNDRQKLVVYTYPQLEVVFESECLSGVDPKFLNNDLVAFRRKSHDSLQIVNLKTKTETSITSIGDAYAFSVDGARVLSRISDELYIHRTDNGPSILLKNAPMHFEKAIFSSDGTVLAVFGTGNINVYWTSTGEKHFEIAERIYNLEFLGGDFITGDVVGPGAGKWVQNIINMKTKERFAWDHTWTRNPIVWAENKFFAADQSSNLTRILKLDVKQEKILIEESVNVSELRLEIKNAPANDRYIFWDGRMASGRAILILTDLRTLKSIPLMSIGIAEVDNTILSVQSLPGKKVIISDSFGARIVDISEHFDWLEQQ